MPAPHPALLPLIRGDGPPAGTEVDRRVVDSADEHYVTALLADAVEAGGLDVSDNLRRRLAAATLAVEDESRRATEAAHTVLEVAEQLGIGVGIFKGIAMAARYPIPHHRPTLDVDVFVDPADSHRIGELAVALGADPEAESAYRAMVSEGRVFEISVPVGDSIVDLHRDPANLILVTRSERNRWDTCDRFDVGDSHTARTLDLEWTLIVALLHWFRDNFADLLRLRDIDLLLDAEPDWDRIEAIAADEGWTDLIRFAAAFAGDHLGRTIPLPRRIKRSSAWMIRRIWPSEMLFKGSTSAMSSHRRQSMLSLLTSTRRSDMAHSYLRRLVPPRSVIDTRSHPTTASYPAALYTWRVNQRRRNRTRIEEAQT